MPRLAWVLEALARIDERRTTAPREEPSGAEPAREDVRARIVESGTETIRSPTVEERCPGEIKPEPVRGKPGKDGGDSHFCKLEERTTESLKLGDPSFVIELLRDKSNVEAAPGSVPHAFTKDNKLPSQNGITSSCIRPVSFSTVSW